MSASSERRLAPGDRLGAWIVTGPLGRLVAFFCDLFVAVAHGAINKLRRR